MELTPQVVEISAADAVPIRLEVLRRGTPTDVVAFPGDDDPSTVHLGIRIGGELVATSTWLRHELPVDIDGDVDDNGGSTAPGGHHVQLRGMATLDAHQGRGLGALLIDEGVRRAKEGGAVEVWANARDTALAFYRQQGFDVVGEGFLTSDTRIPHHVVRRPL